MPGLLEVTGTAIRAPGVPKKYANILQGRLRKVHTKYRIALHPDAKLFETTYPRRVAISLLPAVRNELEHMKDLGVIEQVERSTQRCAPMAAPKKKNNSLRVCVDYRKLIDQTVKERVIMLTLEENLAKLVETK